MTTETDTYAGQASAAAGAVFKRLLLPVDFSESNIAAAQYARKIAGWGDSHVTLLHVKPAGDAESAGVPIDGTYVLNRLKQILGRASDQTVITVGDPADVISQYAGANNVDLVVMPTRGVGVARRFMLGSVTAKVLQNAACPVLTFVVEDGTREHPEPHFRHIACAVDLGADSLRIMNAADAIAKRTVAPMTVLHANPQLEPVVGVVHDHEWCSYLANVLRGEITKLKRQAGIEATVRLAGGEPARAVAETAVELNADLLVIGRPRSRGLLGRLRTHSYAIITEAPCPVLSV